MPGRYLCELCGEQVTNHVTNAWDGREIAICAECLAPPGDHPCWQALGRGAGVTVLQGDAQGAEYLVRLHNGTVMRFRWTGPLRSRGTVESPRL